MQHHSTIARNRIANFKGANLAQSCGALLRIKRDWRASSPSLKLIYVPNASSQNFETAMLFSIVEWSSNYVLRDMGHVNPPQLCNWSVMI